MPGSQLFGYDNRDKDPIPELEKILQEISNYDYGGSRSWLSDFRNLMIDIYAKPKYKSEAETLMINFLESEASIDGKHFISHQLAPMATGKSIPVLSSLLEEETTIEMALDALTMIPDPSVDKLLRKHLKKVNDRKKPAIILAIGKRRDGKSIKQLEDLANHKDSIIAISSIQALGVIGNQKATRVLKNFFIQSAPPLQWAIADQLLISADHLFESGEEEKSFAIYREIYEKSPPSGIRIAALQGILKDPAEDPGEIFLKILKGKDKEFIQAIIPVIRDYPGELDFSSFKPVIPDLSPYEQTILMIAFSDRGDPTIRTWVLQALGSDHTELRMAGLISLLKIADPEDALLLAGIASQSKGEEREVARKCLYQLKGSEVDMAILSAILDKDMDEQLELIRSVAERNISEGISLMLNMAEDTERRIRVEAIRVLGTIGQPAILTELIDLLLNATGRQERNELVKTITLVANRKPISSERSNELLAALPGLRDEAPLMAVIEILGNLGNDQGLSVLREFLSDSNENLQYEAIKALSRWPNDDPVMDLKTVMENSDDIKKHTLALQGYVQLLSSSTSVTQDQKITAYRTAYENSISTDEKKMILSAIGTTGTIKGLEIAVGLLSDKELQAEAEASVILLLEKIPDRYGDEKRKWMKEAERISDNPEFKNKIIELYNE
jgi:HEAT repeat protein